MADFQEGQSCWPPDYTRQVLRPSGSFRSIADIRVGACYVAGVLPNDAQEPRMLIAVGFVPGAIGTSAAGFERAAYRNMQAFWMWAAQVGLVCWGGSLWWAAVPGSLAIHSAFAWRTCKRQATRIGSAKGGSPHSEPEASDSRIASVDRLAA